MKIRGRAIKRQGYIWLFLTILIFGLITTFSLYRYQSASLLTAPDLQALTIETSPAQPLAWPAYGQAAVATKEYGVLAAWGDEGPQPTASAAKLITVLAIMRQKPFSDERGATITFAQADAMSYQSYLAGNGSVVPVTTGLVWTQYQALQAILLGSANNVSDSMAIWAFGSLDAYRQYAQQMVQDFGMKDTTIGSDASGYSPTTTSTAHDLALLATKVLEEPVLREIVGQSQVALPGAGSIENTNRLLADTEILGMKTGWIPAAGGVFVLAGRQTEGQHRHEVITVVMGAPGGASQTAQQAAYALYQSAKSNFSYQEVITKGQQVGAYRAAWSNQSVPIVAKKAVGTFVWKGVAAKVQLQAKQLSPNVQGEVGSAKVAVGAWSMSVPLGIDQPIAEPSWWWRVAQRN